MNAKKARAARKSSRAAGRAGSPPGTAAKPREQPDAPKPPSVDRDALRARGFVALAEVARPHGLAGELRLKVYNFDTEILRQRSTIRVFSTDGAERDAKILASREVDKALLVRVSGVEERNAAEAHRGAVFAVPRSALPPPEEGEFYAWDVEGARAVLPSGEVVGRVLEIASYPTCEVIVVEREGKPGATLEVPLTEAYVRRVDVEGGVVELETIDGLDG